MKLKINSESKVTLTFENHEVNAMRRVVPLCCIFGVHSVSELISYMISPICDTVQSFLRLFTDGNPSGS